MCALICEWRRRATVFQLEGKRAIRLLCKGQAEITIKKSHSFQFHPFKFQFKRRKYYSNFIKFCALTKDVTFGTETVEKDSQVHFIFGLCVCKSVQLNCSKVSKKRLKKKLDNENVKQVERSSQPTKRTTSFSPGSANKSWHRARQPPSKRIRNINGLWINKWWVISKCFFAQFIHYYFTLLYMYIFYALNICIVLLSRRNDSSWTHSFSHELYWNTHLRLLWKFKLIKRRVDCDFDIQRNEMHWPVPWSKRSRCSREFVQRVLFSPLARRDSN